MGCQRDTFAQVLAPIYSKLQNHLKSFVLTICFSGVEELYPYLHFIFTSERMEYETFLKKYSNVSLVDRSLTLKYRLTFYLGVG
jgi:hypothetical protein